MKMSMDAEAKRFWRMIMVGFIIMSVAAGLGLLIGWGGLVGGIAQPQFTWEYGVILFAALSAILVASAAVGYASFKLTK